MGVAADTKVFGIGFHKTGTTSLAKALQALDYRVTGPNRLHDPALPRTVHRWAPRLVHKYDAFQDNPWPLLYRWLDRHYPGSKFILTIRPTDAWLDSVCRHFRDDVTAMRRWVYGVGCPAGNEQCYRDRYNRHNDEVREYFAHRPDDLLVVDLCEAGAWWPICDFLGHPAPPQPFPCANTAGVRERSLRRQAWRHAKRAYYRWLH